MIFTIEGGIAVGVIGLIYLAFRRWHLAERLDKLAEKNKFISFFVSSSSLGRFIERLKRSQEHKHIYNLLYRGFSLFGVLYIIWFGWLFLISFSAFSKIIYSKYLEYGDVPWITWAPSMVLITASVIFAYYLLIGMRAIIFGPPKEEDKENVKIP